MQKLTAALMLITSCAFSAQTNKEPSVESYTTTQKQELTIVGIKCRTSNAPEAGPIDIPKLWARFYSENITAQIPNKASSDVIALYCDYEGDFTKPYSILIGCPVNAIDTIPEGLASKTIPAGSYALFSATGQHPQTLIETWGKIWKTDLKRSYTGDFEVYGETFSNSPPEVKVWIAL